MILQRVAPKSLLDIKHCDSDVISESSEIRTYMYDINTTAYTILQYKFVLSPRTNVVSLNAKYISSSNTTSGSS